MKKIMKGFFIMTLPYIFIFIILLLDLAYLIVAISFMILFNIDLLISIRGSKKTNRTQTATKKTHYSKAQVLGGVDQHHPPSDRFLITEREEDILV